ncbi:TadE/TadG family type IV pilus assembly protein [Vibrio sp. HN007]|uniref:TadE/TadG family type IV pilus assembly protein n=1 Tax=Vibrio iocasae TaxID=3098914 RepID=UPI0035D4C283
MQRTKNTKSWRLNSWHLNNRGSSVVEFAMVNVVLMLLIFTIIDFGIFGYVKLTMQHAVREGARYAITGGSDLDPESSGNREAAVLAKISATSDGLFSKVIDVNDVRVEDATGKPISGFGAAGDMIAIHLDCEWPTTSPFIFPLLDEGKYKFTVSAAMKNEAF